MVFMYTCTTNYKNSVQHKIIFIICNIYIFSLISPRDIFSINGITLLLKMINQCDIKHSLMLPIKTITLVLKVLDIHYHLYNNWFNQTQLVRLVIMSVSTLITANILYALKYWVKYIKTRISMVNKQLIFHNNVCFVLNQHA